MGFHEIMAWNIIIIEEDDYFTLGDPQAVISGGSPTLIHRVSYVNKVRGLQEPFFHVVLSVVRRTVVNDNDLILILAQGLTEQ